MVGVFTNIWLKIMVNVGKYTIHGSYNHWIFPYAHGPSLLQSWFGSGLRRYLNTEPHRVFGALGLNIWILIRPYNIENPYTTWKGSMAIATPSSLVLVGLMAPYQTARHRMYMELLHQSYPCFGLIMCKVHVGVVCDLLFDPTRPCTLGCPPSQ